MALLIKKFCNKCKHELHISSFSKKKTGKMGYNSICKICVKEYQLSIRDKLLQSKREHYYKNRKLYLNRNKLWFIANRQKRNIYQNNRRRNNLNIRLRLNLSRRILDAVRNNRKSKSTLQLIGCSVQMLIKYLEVKFTSEMTWENYGSYWHIDHIIPCAAFDLSKPEEQQKCFHYTNLQPLEAKLNLSKGARMI